MPEQQQPLLPIAEVVDGLRHMWSALVQDGITPGTFKAAEAHLYASAIAHLQRLAEIYAALAEPSIPPTLTEGRVEHMDLTTMTDEQLQALKKAIADEVERRRPKPSLQIGDRVRHKVDGWTGGEVLAIAKSGKRALCRWHDPDYPWRHEGYYLISNLEKVASLSERGEER